MIGRSRTIQPGTFTDATLWDAAQRTGLPLLQGFEGLWCYADREGRFEWKARELKLVILPFWEGDFERVLAALAADGFVVSYEVAGRKYGLVRNFKKHQHINTKESASKLPPVPRGTRESRDGVTTTSRSDQEIHDLFSGSDLDPDFSDPSDDSDPDLTGSAREDDENSEPSEKKSPFASDDERDVFAHWAATLWPLVHKHGEPRATPPRVSRIRARLREGCTGGDLKRVVDSVAQSKWHLGENDTGRAYIEPKTIFRNRETVDEWLSKRAGKPTGEQLHEAEQAKADAALVAEIQRGEWGDKARDWFASGKGSLEKFRVAMREKRVTWRAVRPVEPASSPRATGEHGNVRALVAGIGRTP